MPALEQMDRNQIALLWVRTGTDDYGEHQVANEAVEISVRWNNKKHIVSLANGTPVTIDALVITDREIEVGSAMWLGSLDDLPGTGTGSNPETDLMEVVYCNVTKDLKGRNTRYSVGLKFSKDSLPQQGD